MELLGQTLKQRLSCGVCAVALVFSLSLYKSNVSANPLTAAQQHWEAIATGNPELLATRYSQDAVLTRSYGVSDINEVYQGQSIFSAWQEFFSQYQIKAFQVIEQERRDQSVEAHIEITAMSRQGGVVILSLSHQVHFDKTGKIIKEVWQAHPELSV